MKAMSEPRMPVRVRLHRADHWLDESTGRLRPHVRDAYFGLSTRADDSGYLLWRPAMLGAALYPYSPAGRRERDLIRHGEALVGAELLVIFECGCAFMPRMQRDLSTKGGDRTTVVADYHATSHDSLYGGLRSATDNSVSDSSSSSVSSSVEGSSSDSGSPRARPRQGERQPRLVGGNGAVIPSGKNGSPTEPCSICNEPPDGTGRLVEVGDGWVFAHERCIADSPPQAVMA